MKTNLWLTVFTIALVLNVVMLHNKVEGDECTAGIRKEHLDSTPGAFVDNTTIEIDATNGLQVKPSGLFLGQSSQVIGNTDIATTSTSWVNMSNMSITMETHGKKVLLMFSGSFDASDEQGVKVRFMIDEGATKGVRNLFRLPL